MTTTPTLYLALVDYGPGRWSYQYAPSLANSADEVASVIAAADLDRHSMRDDHPIERLRVWQGDLDEGTPLVDLDRRAVLSLTIAAAERRAVSAGGHGLADRRRAQLERLRLEAARLDAR